MLKFIALLSCVFLLSPLAWSQIFETEADYDRIEGGIAAGVTEALAGSSFKDNARSDSALIFWLGYSLDPNWALEVGYDYFKFKNIDTSHKMITLGAAHRWATQSLFHPVVKMSLGTMESENAASQKTNSFGLKLAGGLETDFKHVSLGALLNYYYIGKAGEVDELKNAQVAVPAVFISFHNALEGASQSPTTAPPAQSTEPPVTRKDSDSDGVLDEDDKCANTAAGVVVNQIGCSEKEKAEMKLNIEFAIGKSELDSKSNSEVEALAQFMKKFPETKIEIGGHSDNIGSVAGNTKLSQKRADAVKAALVAQGIEASRLTAKGYGPTKPVADNKTAEGRAQNRRVMAEIAVITDKKK